MKGPIFHRVYRPFWHDIHLCEYREKKYLWLSLWIRCSRRGSDYSSILIDSILRAFSGTHNIQMLRMCKRIALHIRSKPGVRRSRVLFEDCIGYYCPANERFSSLPLNNIHAISSSPPPMRTISQSVLKDLIGDLLPSYRRNCA